MNVAIVHERFTELGGSEQVVEQLHAIWPDASLHAAVIDPRVLPPGLRDADMRASPLQRLYRGGSTYAHLLPLLPAAMARLNIDHADLVVCSHHAFAHRVRPRRGARIVSYTHTPARWLWEPRLRRAETGGRIGAAALTIFAATQRSADVTAAQRVELVVVNSRHVRDRVRRWWGRDAIVVPPPVDVQHYTPDASIAREEFFLLAGRLAPYKQPEVAAAAAARAGVRLVVAGDGRARRRVEAAGRGAVELLGSVSNDTLRDLYRRCRALVFPGEEDFGIVPVEAQACGAPVIARAVGGALDSVVPGTTGLLYQTGSGDDAVEALASAMRSFEPNAFDSNVLRKHAERFSAPAFRRRFKDAVATLLT